jgi:hypothetical protein
MRPDIFRIRPPLHNEYAYYVPLHDISLLAKEGECNAFGHPAFCLFSNRKLTQVMRAATGSVGTYLSLIGWTYR